MSVGYGAEMVSFENPCKLLFFFSCAMLFDLKDMQPTGKLAKQIFIN